VHSSAFTGVNHYSAWKTVTLLVLCMGREGSQNILLPWLVNWSILVAVAQMKACIEEVWVHGQTEGSEAQKEGQKFDIDVTESSTQKCDTEMSAVSVWQYVDKFAYDNETALSMLCEWFNAIMPV